MAVLLANCTLRAEVRAHPMTRDARGKLVADGGEELTVRGPAPGRVTEPDIEKGPEGGGWRLGVDVALGPLEEGDTLVRVEDGAVFRVRTAKEVRVPGCSDADWIRVVADLDPPKRP